MSVRSPRSDFRAAEAAEAERESREAEADKSFAAHVLARELNWKAYEENKFINTKELGMLLDYDKRSPSDQADLLSESGPAYGQLFIKCLEVIATRDTIEYLIILIDQLLAADPKRACYFQCSSKDCYSPFLRLLLTPGLGYHNLILSRTAHVLSLLLANTDDLSNAATSATQFIKYLIDRLTDTNASSRDYIHYLTALKPLMNREQFQAMFAEYGGVKALLELLNKDTQNAQLIYSVGFNVWLLSYNPAVSRTIAEIGFIKKLVTLLKIQVMEKVLRIILASLRNLLSHNEDSFAEEMIGLGLPAVIDSLSKRGKFKDVDIAPDMEYIRSRLDDTIVKLSNFALYSSEVMSGNLSWTPAHKNEVFWRENIQQFETKNYKLIQKLIDLLADEDDLVREIACFDLGEFARFHGDGKKVIAKLGGKAKLMVNLQSKNPKVQKAALLATQKLMVANWEFLAKSSAGGVASLVQKSK